MENKTHTIDAADKILGRLATKIAFLLQGKHKPDFVPYHDNGDFVVAKNVSQMKFTGKKINHKKFYHHSGYMGGLKETPLKKVLDENPGEVLKRAVWGMLPKNKLRKQRIKRLKTEI